MKLLLWTVLFLVATLAMTQVQAAAIERQVDPCEVNKYSEACDCYEEGA
jgi:hypothetical protein